jgi:hypothetical protein
MTDGSCLDDPTGLRPYLMAMRGGLVNWLVRDGIEDGTLSLLANVGTAIEVYLAAEPPPDMVATGRAVLSDDGAAITLTLYTEVGAVAAISPRGLSRRRCRGSARRDDWRLGSLLMVREAVYATARWWLPANLLRRRLSAPVPRRRSTMGRASARGRAANTR